MGYFASILQCIKKFKCDIKSNNNAAHPNKKSVIFLEWNVFEIKTKIYCLNDWIEATNHYISALNQNK